MIKVNKTLTLFQDVIGIFDVSVDNQKIKQELDSFKLKRLSSKHLESHFEDFNLFDIELLKKDTEVNKLIDIVDQWGQQRNLDLVSSWAHIHQPLESTTLHHHLPSQLSFVYYVSLPEGSGSFAFDFSSICGPIIPIDIKENMLMFFPSWLPHKVSKNLSDGKRISISGNFNAMSENVNG